FTGTPRAPIPSGSDSSDKIATTSFVQGLIAGLSGLYMTSNIPAARSALGLAALAYLNVVTWAQIDATLRGAAADYRSGADQKFMTPKSVFDAQAYVPLPDAATIAIDLNTGINFSVTIAANRTLGFPTNPKVGQGGYIDVTQPGGGTMTLDYASGYTFDQ